jgi:lysophospholipase L1-like esterase
VPDPSRNAWKGNLALLVASLAIGLVVLEFAARSLGLAPAVLRINPGSEDSAFRHSGNPVLGYEWKPAWRDADADLHQSFPETNRDGFRDVERTRAKAPGTRRILLLGDSVAAGVGIRNLDDLISRRLERALGPGHEVLNLGIPGYCTYGEVELLATRGLGYAPDDVLLLFVENDYVPGNLLFARYTFEHPPATEYLFLRSALFRWASLRWDWFGFGAAAQGAAGSDAAGNDALALARYGYGRFRDAVGTDQDTVTAALRWLKDLSVRHGFAVTVAIWPRFSPTLVLEGDHDMAGGEILAVKVARELGFRVVLLSATFRADLAQEFARRGTGVNALDLYTLSRDDPMHPNENGAAVAAAGLAVALGSAPPQATHTGT